MQFNHTPASAASQLDHSEHDERRWGPWLFDVDMLCFVFDPRSEAEAGGEIAYRARGYEVDLYDCATAGQVLHWVGHLLEKGWVTENVIGHLMRAFDDLLSLRDLESAIDHGDTISITELIGEAGWENE